MYRVDITADLNDEDHTGYLWTFLDEARDPTVHLRPLPGRVDDYRALVERTLAS
jgi:hypothetical protein